MDSRVEVRKERGRPYYAVYVDGQLLEDGFAKDAAEQTAAEIRFAIVYEEVLERMQKQQLN